MSFQCICGDVNQSVSLGYTFCFSQDPILQLGWKTGAILPELEKEIETSNSTTFKSKLADLLSLESLLQRREVCTALYCIVVVGGRCVLYCTVLWW